METLNSKIEKTVIATPEHISLGSDFIEFLNSVRVPAKAMLKGCRYNLAFCHYKDGILTFTNGHYMSQVKIDQGATVAPEGLYRIITGGKKKKVMGLEVFRNNGETHCLDTGYQNHLCTSIEGSVISYVTLKELPYPPFEQCIPKQSADLVIGIDAASLLELATQLKASPNQPIVYLGINTKGTDNQGRITCPILVALTRLDAKAPDTKSSLIMPCR